MALINVKKKVDKARSSLGVPDGEEIVAACTTNPKGTVKRTMAVSLGGAVGAAVAAKMSGGDPDDETLDYDSGLADRFVPGQHALVLTDRRLFLASMSALTGKPKSIVAQWKRAEVVSISVEETKLSYPMMITFSDQTAVHIEGAKGTDPRALAI